MDDYSLTSAEIASLKRFHRTIHDKRQAYRVNAVIALGSGWSISDVSEVLLLDAQTVRSYFLQYKESGEYGLVQMNYSGKEPFLNEKQQAELAQHLDGNIYISSREICHYVAATYGVTYSVTGIKYLLHRLGFSYKKPKYVPGKADPAQQAAYWRR
ncbi:MAG: winged helix-turn-helix domain-containing protein [Planctomycetaceae bacterium]|jgi:transposase|nr:winged helix-turn-helix domain-containing protein [Planctomycetaceae bacterium]